jgi:hypothetical protein
MLPDIIGRVHWEVVTLQAYWRDEYLVVIGALIFLVIVPLILIRTLK